MKVLVIGGTGRTGQLVVEKLVAKQHDASVLARSADRLARPGVSAIPGDVRDAASVERAVAGHDVVIYAVGSGHAKPTTLRTDGARHTVAAMQKHGVRRLIAMSGLGAGESLPRLPFVFRKVIAPLFLHGLLADQNGLEQEVRGSGLDFVLVRPGQLVERKARKPMRISLDGSNVGSRIAYDDVAAFIVDQISAGTYVGQAPALGY